MKIRLVPLLALAVLPGLPAHAQLVTTDLLYHWDASDATTALPGTWTSKEGSQATIKDWVVNTGVTRAAVTSSTLITDAYDFTGWASGAVNGSATRGNFDLSGDGITDESVSFEFWLKPDGLANGRQVIFESGGSTRGFCLILDDDQLTFAAKPGDPDSNSAPTALINHTLVASNLTDFVQVVLTIDGVGDTLQLFVNPLASSTPESASGSFTYIAGNQPFGSSNAALAGVNSATGADSEIGGGGTTAVGWRKQDFAGFEGQIGILRVYNDVLTGLEVRDNFLATAPTDAVDDTGSVDDNTILTVVDPGSTPSLLANDTGSLPFVSAFDNPSTGGATVAVNSDGTFSYDPTGVAAYANLDDGETVMDTFTYTIVDDNPTPGVTLALDASASFDNFPWAAKPARVAATGTSRPPFITHAYEFTGTGATRNDFRQGGAYDTSDASFEFWLKPDVIQDSCIFETGGGGTGSGVYLDAAGTLKYIVKENTPRVVLTTSGKLMAGQWHQVVVTFQKDASGSNDEMKIYLDGVLDASDATETALGSWSGTDDAGLGAVKSDEGGDLNGELAIYGPFDGQIATVRFYSNKVLSAPEVAANFTPATDTATVTVTINGVNDPPTVTPESVTSLDGAGANLNLLTNDDDVNSSDVLAVSNIVDGSSNGGAVPLTFTSAEGATVTVAADGTFDYDPSTSASIQGLASGESIVEVFTYDVSDGTDTTPTTVTVTSTTSFPSDDSASTDADTVVNIAVLANDQVRTGAVAGTATGGAVLAFVADDNTAGTNTSSQWFNVGGATLGSIPDPPADPNDATFNLSPIAPPVGVSAAYTFTGGAGISHQSVQVASHGASDQGDATIECVFRPSDQAGNEVLWETGGTGDGSSLTLVGDKVVWTSCNGGDRAAQAVGQLPAGAIASGEFVHVMAQIDLTNDLARIYVNGVLADTGAGVNTSTGAAANLTDWAGGDKGGIGRIANDVGGNIAGLGNAGTFDLGALSAFDGEVAILRTYESLLSLPEVIANFDAVFGTPSAAVFGDIVDVAGGGASVGTPIGLPSGAQVTLKGDGTIDYDPNGQWPLLGVGLFVQDSFTYTVNSAPGTTTLTVNVTIEGTNTNPQITIAADGPNFTEGNPAEFTITASAPVSGDATVNLSYSGTATDGDDFTGQASIMIPDGQSSFALDLTTIVDSLYEGGSETITVTIDSVGANVILGATLQASTTLDDFEAAPVVTIASDQQSVEEGGTAGFTITSSVASDEAITVNLSYSGTATQDTDYTGVGSVMIPASTPGGLMTTADLDLAVSVDGDDDGGECLTARIDSVSIGSRGVRRGDTTILLDAGDTVLFLADFDNVSVTPPNPDATTTGLNAATAANDGTAVGSWVDMFLNSATGNAPGVYQEGNDAAGRGDGIDNNLMLDRPNTGFGEVRAKLIAPADFSGSNTAVVAFDLNLRRAIPTDVDNKNITFIGLDENGEKAFEFYLDASDGSATDGQLVSINSVGTEIPVGAKDDFPNLQGIGETDYDAVRLVLSSGGYTISIDDDLDGTFDSVSALLDYRGTATQVSEILIDVPGDTANGDFNGGITIDEIKVVGVIGNQGPSLTLDGSELANAGTTAIADMVTLATRTFDSANNSELKIADVDATDIDVDLVAVNARGVFTVIGGTATVTGSGTGSVNISGTVTEVNSTLTAGVSYTAGSTGGAEIVRITVDDNGTTGAGGVKAVTHDLTFTIFEDPTVTINQDGGQADPALIGPINFEVVFSEAVQGFGAEGSDVDLGASTTPGTLTAVVTGGPITYNVAVSGMTGSGNVIASIPAGAAQRPVTLEDNVASSSTDNVVEYIQNVAPVATNTSQAFHYATGTTSVVFGAMVVTDGNHGTSGITSSIAAFIDHPAVHPGLNLDDGATPGPPNQFSSPNPSLGFTFEVKFTPETADLAPGASGAENRRVIFEIGGSSNGVGIYLVDGRPYFICKMDSAGTKTSNSLNDLDWDATAGDEMVVVPLVCSPLPAGVPSTITGIFSLDELEYSVNGAAPLSATLLNRSGNNNWEGDNSVSIGINGGGVGGPGGLSSSGLFWDSQFQDLSGSTPVEYARMWNASDLVPGTVSITNVDRPEAVTATLSINSYVNDGTVGSLSSTGGGSFNATTGEWTVSGDLCAVNDAIAALEFTIGTAPPDPVIISVSIDDADEDGGGAVTGTIVITKLITDFVYVDDGAFGGEGTKAGDAITDADQGGAAGPAGIFLSNCFTNLTDALAAVDPASSAVILVNDGDYSTESVTLAGTQTLRLADTVGGVSVDAITTLATNTLDLQGNTLAANSGTVANTISSSAGGLTKNGGGILILQNTTGHTGTTTVNGGILRIGTDGAGLLANLGGNGPVVVTTPGVLEFNPAADTQTITQVGNIGGTGSVSTIGDGTVIFSTPGGNSFSGGFDLGDGAASAFDGVDQGAKAGFVVVNHSDDLGSGTVLSRGAQVQAGSAGVVIPNDIDITGGGFRNGGAISFGYSGTITIVGGAGTARGFGNYGLEGTVITVSGTVDTNDDGLVQIEGSNGRDNGAWIFSGTVTDLVGTGGRVSVNVNFDDGEVTMAGGATVNYTGATDIDAGIYILDASHAPGFAGPYTVDGAILKGIGATDGPVTVGPTGTLSPGASIGTLTTGGLTISGNLEIEINDPGSGTVHDQVIVNGAVDIDGAILILVEGSGAGGTEYPIILNDDTDPVLGTFAAIGDGELISPNFLGDIYQGRMNYDGPGVGGNDVTIDATALSIIATWRNSFFASPDNAGDAADNVDNPSEIGGPDDRVNLLEFAFGTDPTQNDPGVLGLAGPSPGDPWVEQDPFTGQSGIIVLRYVRRKDRAEAGLTYTPEFVDSAGGFYQDPDDPTPVFVADIDATFEIVEVPFPLFDSTGKKADSLLGRVIVEID